MRTSDFAGRPRAVRPLLALLALVATAACSSNDTQAQPPPVEQVCKSGEAKASPSVEWVSFHTEVPFNVGDFHGLVSGLIGPEAQKGKLLDSQEVSPGIFLGATADPTTPDQSRVSLRYDDGSGKPIPVALVPASFSVGSIFLTTIDAALATMEADNKQEKGSGESFLLQYQVTSPKGGTFSLGVHAVSGVYTLMIDVSSPTTNLAPGKIGTPATSETPYDTINGTVWFHLSQDDFDYFVDHAYGRDATAAENFKDFALEPHRWLRLTVDPHLDQKYVDVSFAVLGLDGNRTPFAAAPASILAGHLFQSLVDKAMTSMTAQEAKKAGSSSPWTIPFYYDAPSNGGVVQVIAQGQAGVFSIAYAVTAPQHTVKDVPFLPYQQVDFKPPGKGATAACDKLGNPGIVSAPEGAFDVTFDASSVILDDKHLKGPLKGDLECSVFNAADVDIDGPKPGVKSLQDFVVKNANLSHGPAPHYVTDVFPAGSYQILCFQDLFHDGNVDSGDPVTLPIGSLPLACNVNPVTVQFALLNP